MQLIILSEEHKFVKLKKIIEWKKIDIIFRKCYKKEFDAGLIYVALDLFLAKKLDMKHLLAKMSQILDPMLGLVRENELMHLEREMTVKKEIFEGYATREEACKKMLVHMGYFTTEHTEDTEWGYNFF